MRDYQSGAHVKWECKYHVTWIPKYRKKELYGDLRIHLGDVFRELARRADCEILEGHLLPDHSHMLISIPPKYSVAEVVGFMKGKKGRNVYLYCADRFWNDLPLLRNPDNWLLMKSDEDT